MASCAVVLLSLGGVGLGQTQETVDPCRSAAIGTPGKPCPAPASRPSVAEEFPFPGEATPAPQAKPGPQGRDTPAASDAAKAVKDNFPYPGETAADTGGPSSTTPEAAASGSSSSAGDAPAVDPDAKPGLKDEGTTGSTAPKRRRLRPPAQKTLSDDERVDEDLTVAHFYQQSGNLNGAYLRVKDAVKTEPNAATPHFALGQIAEKLNKRDEAISELKLYLQLEPDGDNVKAARKALEKLQP